MDDVAFNKKESIERCVLQIRQYYTQPSDKPFADDHLKQDAIAANLQRAAELCIDLVNHAIRKKRLGIPKSSADSFAILQSKGYLPSDLSSSMQKMVGFRNILVHEYKKVDIAVFVNVIEHRLDDFVAFSTAMLRIE